jgi:hypothetical protein
MKTWEEEFNDVMDKATSKVNLSVFRPPIKSFIRQEISKAYCKGYEEGKVSKIIRNMKK